ncbi:hypothetical protein HELRODRAFT_161284 [Helobdella robusta]|uniref:Uncharacterized protein n=1 Tax=Helobdella robusta TaxID=6412 RepID=T1ERA5_HELRO|nr:hypothetical protein HELRODRAFT_161284 [Helobdella robusta]ESO02056.1 hypothetical protein HELRODRAFT_161284 [Helobdella robusta]
MFRRRSFDDFNLVRLKLPEEFIMEDVRLRGLAPVLEDNAGNGRHSSFCLCRMDDGIKNSKKGENYAFCEYCSTDVSIANAGVSSIKQHFEKEVHKNNVKIKKSTVGISKFFHSNNLPTSRKTAAAEGAFAYHVAFHSLSFKAADCTNRLISTVFAESETGRKFSSAQTKTQTIISRILAPKSIENLLSELGSEPFSIATDS